MIGNSTGISIVELWPCKDTFPTFLHGEVVAAVNKMLTDKCITCQKISGHMCIFGAQNKRECIRSFIRCVYLRSKNFVYIFTFINHMTLKNILYERAIFLLWTPVIFIHQIL